MKIVALTWEFFPNIVGGLGMHSYELYRRMARENDVYVLCLARGDEKNKDYVEGVKVYRIKSCDNKGIYGLFLKDTWKWWYEGDYEDYNIQCLEVLKHIDDSVKIDLIHAHDWLCLKAGLIAKSHLNKKLIFTVHSLETGRTKFPNANVIELEKMGKNADKVITNSDFMKNELIKLGYEPERIEVIYNGIDIERYNPERSDLNKDEVKKKFGIGDGPVILFLGRAAYVKGFDVLLRAFSIVLSKHENAVLVMRSGGEMQSMAEEMINQLGIQKNVIFIKEFIDEFTKINLINACDIYVVPSLYEPFGIVVLEGMAMKKPVIASNTGGIREIINNERNGILFEPGNVNELAEKISYLIIDEDRRKALGDCARKRAYIFSWEKSYEKTLNVYNEILYR
ncbi:MAG: glycosyltransferase family 4 protein [Candidatus Parvarchaeota archaeon]|nr:glycosyltransferase family 4 protein [Candidatus Jingweiarchaeum tengchongense]MCW1309333.1 glycosyltransferase family 4 protein [Candidatus Jingweiarchaeum tengchongense]